MSHLCVHVLDIITMWLEEKFNSVRQDFHSLMIVQNNLFKNDHIKVSLMECVSGGTEFCIFNHFFKIIDRFLSCQFCRQC